ncbi:hypothetical protein [Paenibacillus sp.]|uniref:hypothetical protein n=1 Tax=Paenibacillus sp. TaxID=58172 RepID=UPI002D5C321B|nr:hypothetical protein [Paenibacillus sp.]HZG85637.1 hypothetical protein [Paenibacillus sp.]
MSEREDDVEPFVGGMEMDSDANEDPKREKQLDDAFGAWYEMIDDQVKRKLELTNVPEGSGFDAAAGLDEEPS